MAGDEEARARATLVEMQLRLSQGPHIALGVAEIPTPEQVRAAFLDLTKQYHPARFGRSRSRRPPRADRAVRAGVRKGQGA